MTDETEAAAPEQTLDDALSKPNTAALAAIEGAVRRRGPGRPPRVEPTADTSGRENPHEPAGDGVIAKRKKKSGRKPTRAELAAQVAKYKSEIRAQHGAPAETGAAPADAPARDPLMAGDSAAKEKFTRGCARFFGMISRVVARRRGAHWELTKDERDALGESVADCIEAAEEAMPEMVTPLLVKAIAIAPVCVLAGVGYELVDSRLDVDAEIKAGRKERVMPAAPGPALVKDAATR